MGIQIKYNDGDNFKELRFSIDQHEESIRKQVADLGAETADKMKEIIDQGKVRPQADEPKELEDHINVEHFTTGGWGVGDIQVLNEKAPHWRVVNFGSFHMVGKHLPPGTFQPGVPQPTPTDFRQGRWKPNQLGSVGGRLYSPIVTKPIPAMNYIEKTINFIRGKLHALTLRGNP